jgi:heterodisulfide reductase subunit B
MAAYAYFPGCSLTGIGRPYDESVRAVFSHLGLDLEEIPDWNCCGATSYMSIHEEKAVALASRNLAIAESMDRDIVAPCAACYLVLTKAQHVLAEYPRIAAKVRHGLSEAGLACRGTARIRHPLDILANDVGVEALRARVTNRLDGYRVAPYYGCQVVRPYGAFDDTFAPKTLERVLGAAGADVIDYALKTRCCGGSLMGTQEEVGLRLSFLLLREARERGANVVATLCPLCQFNLESHQGRMRRVFGEDVTMPVAYFTQLVGLALGLSPKSLGLQRNFVVAAPLPVPA